MADLESKLALADDAPVAAAHAEATGARLERDETQDMVWWLTTSPLREPEQRFFTRIAWSRYPHAAPSVKFATAVGGRLDATSAWPIIPGYRPGAYDICQPFTSEGFAVHPEWSTGPEAWSGTGNPFLWVVSILVHDMCDRYGGRSG